MKMMEGDKTSFTEVSHLFVDLKHNLKWADIEQTYQQLMVQMPTAATTLVEDSLLNKVSYVSNYVDNDVLKRREEMISTEQQWLEVFGKLNEWQIPYKNCLAIVPYLLCLPGTNAPIEQVFSLMNTMWTSKKLSLETLRSMLIVKFNMASCENFYEILNQNPELIIIIIIIILQ
ncbi:hypothetical protein PR048_015255 [Dryococelus australis]|uniref:HAT C-terminal dimerisation domain-containing protein n=1 Tax=Dryococelus australis TaxID=614101 RepID=A0ABQ9HGF7_9NEOP|nr:hypothetical protein PR048_015255 [Dryococelus australis]